MNQRQLQAAILRLYTTLPDTPDRPRTHDRKIARELAQQRLPYPLLKAAFLLASARRSLRSTDLEPLAPIRSIAYFLPVLQELSRDDVDPLYLEYLEDTLTTSRPPQL